MAVSLEGLRLLQAVAIRGSLSAAAVDLEMTQSAASRQLAVLERSLGRRLVERGPRGARLTTVGAALLPHAVAALQSVATAEETARGSVTVPELRLGFFPSAGAALLPRLISTFAARHPLVRIRTREGSSPSMIRAVGGGRLDAAIVVSRPPFRMITDDGGTRLHQRVVGTMNLAVAVPSAGPLTTEDHIGVDELGLRPWVGSARSGGDPTLGVWPGLPGRTDVRYRSDDWLTKLRLVMGGLAVTTVPPIVNAATLDGVKVVRVDGAPPETRQVTFVSARPLSGLVLDVLETVQSVFYELTSDAG